MPLINLSVALPPVEPPKEDEPDETKHINLRISLFYDGTKNNRENVQSRQSTDPEKNKAYQDTRSKKYILFGELGEGHVSYTNDESNISFLEAYLISKKEGSDLHLKVYTEGAGTVNLGGDATPGAGFGAGSTGIPAKVKKGILDAKKLIRKPNEVVEPEITVIDTLSIDVFGFSRGAATARYAIHLLLHDESMMIQPGPKSMGYKEITKIEVRLAGLFDTVASFREGLFIGNETWLLSLDAVMHAKKVLHLAAADEHRKNFSLTNIISKGGEQYFLPGVHSDIGGGYTDGEDESQVIFKGSPHEAEQDMKYLMNAGWYLEGQIHKEDFYTTPAGPHGVPMKPVLTSSHLHVARPKLPTAYCIIPLKIMAEFLIDDGIGLNNDYKQKTAVIDSIPELKNIHDHVMAEYTSATTPEYWINRNDPWLRNARNRYFHFSAHYESIGMGPRFHNGKRTRKQYDG